MCYGYELDLFFLLSAGKIKKSKAEKNKKQRERKRALVPLPLVLFVCRASTVGGYGNTQIPSGSLLLAGVGHVLKEFGEGARGAGGATWLLFSPKSTEGGLEEQRRCSEAGRC